MGNNPKVQYVKPTPWNAGQPLEMPVMKTMQKYEIMLQIRCKIKRIHKAAFVRTAAIQNKYVCE